MEAAIIMEGQRELPGPAVAPPKVGMLARLFRGETDIFKSIPIRTAQFSASAGFETAGSRKTKSTRVYEVDWRTLRDLSDTDPVIFAIKTTIKGFVGKLDWDIVPDVDDVKRELKRWRDIAIANLNPWGLSDHFYTEALDKKLVGDVDTRIREIQKSPYDRAEKIRMVRWTFQMLENMVAQEALKYCGKVKKAFEQPNDNTEPDFATFQGRFMEDILTFDAGSIARLAQDIEDPKPGWSRILPGNEIMRWLTENRYVPIPPNTAYTWEPYGEGNKGDFTRDELCYAMQNPRYDGYGYSPVECIIHVITASLYADIYALESLKEANIPPAIINLGKDISGTDRDAYQQAFENRMLGSGRHKVSFVAGTDKVDAVTLRNMTAQDMELDKYQRWTLQIKCMVYGVSPQDIGVVIDFHRTTAEVQQVITSNRGIANLMTFNKRIFTRLIKTWFPAEYKVCRFMYIDDPMESPPDIAKLPEGVKIGAMSRNEYREKLNLAPEIGCDELMVQNQDGSWTKVEDLTKQLGSGDAPGNGEEEPTKPPAAPPEEQKGAKVETGITGDARKRIEDRGVKIAGTVTDDHLKTIAGALQKVPRALLDAGFSVIRTITCDARMGKSKSKYPNHGKWEPDTKTMRLNPDVFSDKGKAEHTVAHEFGHVVDEVGKYSESPAWMKLSGWKFEPDKEEIEKCFARALATRRIAAIIEQDGKLCNVKIFNGAEAGEKAHIADPLFQELTKAAGSEDYKTVAIVLYQDGAHVFRAAELLKSYSAQGMQNGEVIRYD